MTLDNGTLEIGIAENRAPRGGTPRMVIATRFEPVFYGELQISYGRQYTAKGVGQQIDRLVRVWQDRRVSIGMVAILDGEEQYRIDDISHHLDKRGEPVTDLTLRRLEKLYELADDSE